MHVFPTQTNGNISLITVEYSRSRTIFAVVIERQLALWPRYFNNYKSSISSVMGVFLYQFSL